MALARCVNVYIHPFKSFGNQRNYALDAVDTKNDWILFLDADEVSTDLFIAMVNAINKTTSQVAGFYRCWKMILNNTWLKRSDNFPKWQFRLLHKGRGRFRDFGHGQKEAYVKDCIWYIRELIYISVSLKVAPLVRKTQ